MFHPRLSPGGGATEMAVAVRLGQLAKSIEGVQQWPYKAVAEAMEVIPRTLIQNAGASPVRVLTALRAKHAEGGSTWGIDGDTGKLVDMKEYGVWEPEAVKLQSIKTAIEVCSDNHSIHCTVLILLLVRLLASQSGRYLQRKGCTTSWRRWCTRYRRRIDSLVMKSQCIKK